MSALHRYALGRITRPTHDTPPAMGRLVRMGRSNYYKDPATGWVYHREKLERNFSRWRRVSSRPLHRTGAVSQFWDTVESGIDQLVCPVDVPAFKQRCRIPLYKNAWNVWALAVRLREGQSPESLRQEIEGLFGRKLRQRAADLVGLRMDPWFADQGRATNLTIGFFFPSPGEEHAEGEIVDMAALRDAQTRAAEEYQGLPAPRVAADQQTACDEITMDGPLTIVMVSFVYRGDASSMAWPVTRRIKYEAHLGPLDPAWWLDDETLIDVWCPVQADMAVLEVFESPKALKVPSDPDDLGIPWDEYANTFLKGLADTPSRTLDTLNVLGIGALALGVAWGLSQLRR